MTVQITPMDATLGAEVSNVSIRDLSDEDFKEIEDAFNEYGVLVFHDQNLTEAEQLAFGARFGPLFRDEVIRDETQLGAGAPGYFVPMVGNVDRDGNHRKDRSPLANNSWHSDSSFQRLGATASILAGLEVCKEGGQTEFADMRAAYDELPAEETERLAGLRAWHSVQYSHPNGDLPEDLTTLPGAEHSMVRVHPVTGRHSLVIGAHLAHIFGMDDAEGHSLATKLVDDACQPPRLYSHQWRVGDVVVWDNRSVMHRARPYDPAERRSLRHVRVTSDVEF